MRTLPAMSKGSKKIRKRGFLILSIGTAFLLSFNASAQNGEAIFKQSCSACHTVGGGRLVGPDLKGVHTKRTEAWLIKFIKASQSLVKSGDADAKAIFDQYQIVMPDQNLTDADIKAVIAYIGSKSPAEQTAATEAQATPAAVEPAMKKAADASAEDFLAGQNLFSGKTPFKNGGAACISCHNVDNDKVIAGGTLAKDLTTVFTRLGGEAGLNGILNAPPFPAMTQAYKNRGLTEDEIYQLTAFLYKADKDRIYQHAGSQNILIYGGLAGLAALLCLTAIIWYNRKKRTVKYDIYNRQIKSI